MAVKHGFCGFIPRGFPFARTSNTTTLGEGGGADFAAPTVELVEPVTNPPQVILTAGSGVLLEDGDHIIHWIDGTEVDDTIDAGEAADGELAPAFSALSGGSHNYKAKHIKGAESSGWSNVITFDPPAVITSSATGNNAENSVLAHALTASETVTWSIVGGADQADFELSGSTLRWAANGTKDYETPDDANTNNTYVVNVRATDSAANTTDQTITITVTDVVETYPELGVVFDGSNDYLRVLSTPSGLVDAKTALFFLSLDFPGDAGATQHIFKFNNTVTLRRFTDGAMILLASNTSASLVINLTTAAASFPAGRTNLLIALDADGTSRLWAWRESTGSWASLATDATGGGVNLDFTGTEYGFLAQEDGSDKTTATAYRIAVWTGISLPDITNSAVRANFADAATGGLIDPATSVAAYGTPVIDIYGNATFWNNDGNNNHGSGGGLTMQGTVVDA